MDKIIARTRMAERQVARRAKKAAKREWTAETKWDRIRRKKALNVEIGEQTKMAIKARHEAWELGPLAPRRDLNSLKDGNGVYWGSLSSSRIRHDYTMTEREKEARCKWAGGVKHLCLAVGDRVVVTEGSFKNEIGEIDEIKLDSATVTLKEHFKVNTTMPSYITNDEVKAVMPFRSSFPISAVRLVHPIRNPATKEVRDVIIREIQPTRFYHDRISRRSSWHRVVPGLNVEIPWPPKAVVEKEEFAGDTLRIDVEEKTFVPTLLRPPMPDLLINELRNQYSKFRTRHTEEYIAQREAEEAEKKARAASGSTMLTPLQEFTKAERERRKARGQPVLTDEMLQKIGQVIAKNQARMPAKNWSTLWNAAQANSATPDAEEELGSAIEQLSLNEQADEPTTQAPPS